MLKIYRSRGFTLIELLVVISIIALLSSVSLASFSSARVKARDIKRVQDILQMQKALELYYSAQGKYPDPNPLGNNGISCWECGYYSGSRDATKLGQLSPYLKTRPTDPRLSADGNSGSISGSNYGPGFWYFVSLDGQNYKLINDCTVENFANVPAKLQDTQTSMNDHYCGINTLTIYSSAVSKDWSVINQPFHSQP
jgi:prepilin-type N-terminal cleavage/methylation domain-containing protein